MSDFPETRSEVLDGQLRMGGARSSELEALMARYQTHDPQAGELLVERMSTPMFRYFLAHTRDRSMAEDLLQDFWLRIHNARHSYRVGEPLLPWLYAIAHRVRIDDYRKNRRSRQQETLDEHAAYPAKEESPEPERNIGEILRQLPASQREAILLMKVNGLSLEEVARATGVTVGSVKQKVHRGYQKLRSLLDGRT